MKTKKFKGIAVYGIEADSLEEAQELASDVKFLESLVNSDEVKIAKIECTGVEETDPRFYDLTCELSGEAGENVDLKTIGITVE